MKMINCDIKNKLIETRSLVGNFKAAKIQRYKIPNRKKNEKECFNINKRVREKKRAIERVRTNQKRTVRKDSGIRIETTN